MDSFVCRHVLVVLLFRGRRAHEGDDAAVLNRKDRRVAMTLVIYLSCLIPALLVDNVGSVLAFTGTIAASSISYIGPGLVYLGVYGDDFLQKVDDTWFGEVINEEDPDAETSSLMINSESSTKKPPSFTQSVWKLTAWYMLWMPLWCAIARIGKRKLKLFREKEALKSPHLNRLGKIKHAPIPRASSYGQALATVQQDAPYGTVTSINQEIGAAIIAQKTGDGAQSAADQEEIDSDAPPPTWYDFGVAIFFIIFGVLALSAGLVSIMMT